ncbi:DNA primase large subunit Spp2 [Didymella glomerata]|uniref:Pre-mRNA-splicing factor n=1 Tax=Didymella glomerata TaxID=749621 RepID=A0A9W8X3Y3_9PLEO|nr:DNA primase large subunit Spp2 [Didymella glomerata]
MAAGGFKMSLGGLKAKPGLKSGGLKNSSAANGTKPKKALLGDDEPEDAPKAQQIAAFDAAQGGAIDINGPAEKKGPLVIPSLPNRNWRDEARKRKAQLEKAPHTMQTEDVVMEEPEKEVVYGLTVPSQRDATQEATPAEAMEIDSVPKDGDAELTDAQRLEKAALEHLLNGKTTDTQRVVPALTDEQALANDLVDAPDEPSLDAYEATPIEGFGLAMLRGMGWRDSDGESRATKNGTKNPRAAPKEVKRRPALLGIGAKEDAAKDVELGEFNSKARPKKGQKDAPAGYNPVTLRNKKTGEVISEEDLKRKLESQDIVPDEKPREKESRRRDDEYESDRRSSRRDVRDGERRRGDDYDSERRRDRERKDDRRRDKHDDDSDRRREKRRDRSDDHDSERRSEKRRDRDRDRRDRSRSPRDEKRRDRYRSRSRDSKDRPSRRDRSRSRDDDDRRRRRRERDRDDRSSRR